MNKILTSRPCPICGEMLKVPLSMPADSDYDHMLSCGLAHRGDSYREGQHLFYLYCACGVPFLHANDYPSIRDLFNHIDSVPHDWKKLAVRRTMEDM